MTARTDASALPAASASRSPASSAGFIALSTAGRFRVIVMTPASTAARTADSDMAGSI